jgi:aryl-alcohol dehydrogenase-like predicted oxidoreductase
MENSIRKRAFGTTDLQVSEVGFGAWGIGGPAMAGQIPIGWGDVDDFESVRALETALDRGINFFDTADVYGRGHSEELIGSTFGNRDDVVVATKVGHRVDEDGTFVRDYERSYIVEACEASLRRLRRETIDYYQLHSAHVAELERGECVDAMESLRKDGKIRNWGVSLNTFDPYPEADYLMEHHLGDGFQVVLNIINQRALGLIAKAARSGYGIIARMPLQFGLLTGKFDRDTRFDQLDHRSLRLTPEVLARALDALQDVWPLCEKYGIDKTALSLSFVLSTEGVSTVIPGIKTPAQAIRNTSGLVELDGADVQRLHALFESDLDALLTFMYDVETA